MGLKLKNAITVITGGNSGIGLAAARTFISEGAKVVLFGRDAAAMNAALRELGANSTGVVGDVTSSEDLNELFAEIKNDYGRIDSLFVNAGISKSMAIDQITEGYFDELFDINVKGAFFTIQKALPLMKENSSIVVTTSNVLHNGYDELSVYSATKGAMRSMVRSIAAELLQRKIRINCVSPGPIVTRLLTKNFDAKTHEMIMEKIAQQIPVKRMGEADEVAKAVLFLASSDSSFMTGEEIIVDGGMTAIG